MYIEGYPFITRFKTIADKVTDEETEEYIEGYPFITRFKT